MTVSGRRPRADGAPPNKKNDDEVPTSRRASLDDFPDVPAAPATGRAPSACAVKAAAEKRRRWLWRGLWTALAATALLLFWPVGPRPTALLGRLPADYRFGLETRALNGLLEIIRNGRFVERFGRTPLAGLLTDGGKNPPVWEDANAEWMRAFAAPVGLGLAGAAANGSVAVAWTDPDGRDQVIVVHTLRCARAVFAWRFWREAARHVPGGRPALRLERHGIVFYCRAVDGLLVGVTRPERLDEIEAALRADESVPLPVWAKNPPQPAILFRWTPPPALPAPAPPGGTVDNGEDDDDSVAPAGGVAAGSNDNMGGLIPDWRDTPAPPYSPDESAATERAAAGTEINAPILRVPSAWLAAIDESLSARGLVDFTGVFMLDEWNVRLAANGAFAPGIWPSAPVPSMPTEPPTAMAAAWPATTDQQTALVLDHRAALGAAARPELLPPGDPLSSSTPRVVAAGRFAPRSAWLALGKLLWPDSGRPLRGVAPTSALLAWEAAADGWVAATDGRFALGIFPPPPPAPPGVEDGDGDKPAAIDRFAADTAKDGMNSGNSTDQADSEGDFGAVPPLPEIFVATGLSTPERVEKRFNRHLDNLVAAIAAPGGDVATEAMRRTVQLRTIPGGDAENGTTVLSLPPLLANYARPAWSLRAQGGDDAALLVVSHAGRLRDPVRLARRDAGDAVPSWVEVAWNWRLDAPLREALLAVTREKAIVKADISVAEMARREDFLSRLDTFFASVPVGYGRLSLPMSAPGEPTRWGVQLLAAP